MPKQANRKGSEKLDARRVEDDPEYLEWWRTQDRHLKRRLEARYSVNLRDSRRLPWVGAEVLSVAGAAFPEEEYGAVLADSATAADEYNAADNNRNDKAEAGKALAVVRGRFRQLCKALYGTLEADPQFQQWQRTRDDESRQELEARYKIQLRPVPLPYGILAPPSEANRKTGGLEGMAIKPGKGDHWRLYRRHLHRLCPEFKADLRPYWSKVIEELRLCEIPHGVHTHTVDHGQAEALKREAEAILRELRQRWPEAPEDAFTVKPLQRAEWDAIPLAWVLHQAPDVDPAPPEVAYRLFDDEHRGWWELMPELLPAWRRQKAARVREARARVAMAPPPDDSRNRKRNERLVIQWPGLPADSVEARRLNALALAEADIHGLRKRRFTWPEIVEALWPNDWDLRRYREAEGRKYPTRGERTAALEPLRKQFEKPLRKLLREARSHRESLYA